MQSWEADGAVDEKEKEGKEEEEAEEEEEEEEEDGVALQSAHRQCSRAFVDKDQIRRKSASIEYCI